MNRNEKWYQRRLAGYFVKKYEKYEDETSFWTDPDINSWLFDIPSLKLRIELVCDDSGKVTEQQYNLAGDL